MIFWAKPITTGMNNTPLVCLPDEQEIGDPDAVAIVCGGINAADWFRTPVELGKQKELRILDRVKADCAKCKTPVTRLLLQQEYMVDECVDCGFVWSQWKQRKA